jgi:hypothetical protein
MKQAGCEGVNFGVDSLCDEQLSRFGRGHSFADVQQLVRILNDEKMNYIFDLLIGGPGETQETIRTTIERAKGLALPLTGIAAGIRVYPGIALAEAIAEGSVRGGLHPSGECSPDKPVFYLSPLIEGDVSAVINRFVAGDPRFFLLSAPAQEGSYNYADDDTLSKLIEQGARGAYWDILRKNR